MDNEYDKDLLKQELKDLKQQLKELNSHNGNFFAKFEEENKEVELI